MLGVGKVVLGLVTSVVVVVIVTVYLLVDLPRVKRGIYQLAPKSRRARMVLLTDEILDRVGGYVLGNLLTSFIAGLGTWIWALAFGIPYALLLGILVALFDLIPIIGSTIGGDHRVARRADRLAAGRDRDGDLLRRLPLPRGLPADAADHGAHGRGAGPA